MNNSNLQLPHFIREKRKSLNMTQVELAAKAGVGIRFLRELERGKKTLRMDKVNEVLELFGFELGPLSKNRNNNEKG